MKKREEIPVNDTWNMADILPSDEAWEERYKETEQALAGYEEFEGQVGRSPNALLRCLEFDEAMSLKVERLFVYARQKSDEDTANSKYQDFSARAQALSYGAARLSSFIVPEILSMDDKILAGYFEKEAKLRRYGRSLAIILEKKSHTLSAPMEELLARSMEATQNSSRIFNMFNNADAKFPSITNGKGQELSVTHGTYSALMENRDRTVRKAAFESLYQVYDQYSNTLAATYAANAKQAAFYAAARNYSSSRAYYLAENEIPEKVYDNLLAAIEDGLPLLHDYVKLRKKSLGVSELHMYDLYTPLVSRNDKKIPYGEAKELVKKGLAPLGEEYVSLLQAGFDNRWIDVYENEGKRSGAYSWGVYGSHPYVLLNYNETLDSVFTLAHEMGHSLHTWFSNQSQAYVDAGYRIFVAEVASTCNEALLNRHLLSVTEDKKERAYLLNHFMDSFRGTMFRQAMFAEFEAETHKRNQAGEPLTANLLCSLYYELNKKYYGPQMTVDEEIACEWARIPHFYTPFYVYQYATGFSAAIAISSRILAGDSKVLEGYFQFLKGGNSMPPLELLKLCKVDMSTAKPVKEAISVFAELLAEFKEEQG